MPKLCPMIILEGIHPTHKTEIAAVLNEHPRIVGPRTYRYHLPIISAKWCGSTAFPKTGALLTWNLRKKNGQ